MHDTRVTFRAKPFTYQSLAELIHIQQLIPFRGHEKPEIEEENCEKAPLESSNKNSKHFDPCCSLLAVCPVQSSNYSPAFAGPIKCNCRVSKLRHRY